MFVIFLAYIHLWSLISCCVNRLMLAPAGLKSVQPLEEIRSVYLWCRYLMYLIFGQLRSHRVLAGKLH